jgi:hypothetical protein
MKYFEGELSSAQIEAGVAVMRGEFDAFKVMAALRNAGAETVSFASERLLARELKAGRITRVTQGIYRQA